jgi:hypothetical protein
MTFPLAMAPGDGDGTVPNLGLAYNKSLPLRRSLGNGSSDERPRVLAFANC